MKGVTATERRKARLNLAVLGWNQRYEQEFILIDIQS